MKILNSKLSAVIILSALVSSNTFATNVKLTEKQLGDAIESRLISQLEDKKMASHLTNFLMKEVLTWKAETIDIKKADTIVAYAFGNRIDEKGNKLPGSMNKQLADMVVDVYNKTHKPVYAQWEIAQEIGARIDAKHLTSINPTVTETGNVIYLSTRGVANEVTRIAGGADKLGTTLVLGFSEHHLRTVNMSREAGMDAYAPEGYKMPRNYDQLSGQPWTRDNETFTMYEVETRAWYDRERLMLEKNYISAPSN